MLLHLSLFIFFILLSYSSIFIATLITRFAFDEVHSLKKWYTLIQTSILSLVLFCIILFYQTSISVSIILGSLSLLFLFWNKTKNHHIDYLIISILLGFSSFNAQAFFYILPLSFLFGLILSFQKAQELFFVDKKSVDRDLPPKQVKELIRHLWQSTKIYPFI